MRRPADFPVRRPAQLSRGRMALIVLAIAAFVLITSLRGIARFYTDYLWFDSLDLRGVWSSVLGAKVVLSVLFTLAFFVIVWTNLWLADRFAPRFRPAGPEEEVIARYRELVGQRAGLVRVVVAALFALIGGLGVSREWNSWLLFRNGVDFGVKDPQFHVDVGFYVFKLPFLSFVVDWLFAALIVTTIVAGVAHYLNGGIRFQVAGQRVTPQVKSHLSVLLGLLALLRTADYFLQRFELNFSSRGVVTGASYTDVKAQLPALNLLVIISIAAAILFLVNIRMRGWVLPVIAVGLWAFVSLMVATIYPAFIQRFRVEPAESDKERPYIERNIAATRAAMGLDKVTLHDFDYEEKLTTKDLDRNEPTLRNVRLWDPSGDILGKSYQRLQEVRTFYRFNDVDVDRYVVNGRLTQVLLSARELNSAGLPSGSWENQVLAYTHGYGVVLSPASEVTPDGQPTFLVKDVPPVGKIDIEQPAIYFGEQLPSYAVVNTTRDEIDYPTGTGLKQSRYKAESGVKLNSFARRAAFALRFGDINPLISNFVTSDSKILFLRDVRDRVEAAAPFLHFDDDPYPVVIDGRIHWIIDAYTTTSRYPYAQQADVSRLAPTSGLNHRFNYARNSVKAVVDAYDGDLTFYVVDPDDPIAEAYRRAFPNLFTSVDEAPAALVEHFRYPEDLFRVQTDMWGRYHIDEPGGFYSQSDSWTIAKDPASGLLRAGGTGTQATLPGTGISTVPARTQRMDPYYLLMRLPEEQREEFLILQPFVPFSANDQRQELAAFMVAKSDPESYGELEVFVMPRSLQVDGPALVDGKIQATPAVSREVTLLSQSGSSVLQGNLLVIPIERSLLYVRPLYVQGEATKVPELKKVVVVFGDRVEIGDTFEEALAAVFGRSPVGEEPSGGEEPTTGDGSDVAELIERASRLFEQADAARRKGDFVTYLQKVEEAGKLIDKARQASGASTTTTTAPPAAA